MTLIAQISDLHLTPEGGRCYGLVDTNRLAADAVDAVNRLRIRPEAVVVTGDIIDTANAKDYALAKEILSRLDMPFYLLSGNHDQSAGLKHAFSDLEYTAVGTADRLYYTAEIGSVRLIALDSSVPGAAYGALSAEQLAFLDCELASADTRPVVIALHHPPISTGNRLMDGLALRDATKLAKVVRKYPKVLRILCGHCHRAVFGTFAGTTVAIAPATGHQLELALDGDDTFGFTLEPPAFFVHRWTESDGMTTHLAMVDPYPGPYPFYGDRAGEPSVSA